MKTLSYALILFISMGILNAQEVSISGTITDKNDNVPIPGINIIEKGTSNGTQTDFDGNYTLQTKIGAILQFSYVGYVAQEVKVTSKSTSINIQMESSTAELEEVVIVGYGNSTRNSITSSVHSISNHRGSQTKKERKRVKSNIRIRGAVSHFNKSNSNAVLGSGTSIKIRGNAPISTKKEPLYIVDGIPIDAKDIGFIQKLDVKEISKTKIYKETEAKSIFGTMAKHGCIVITTHAGNYRVENDESYKEIIENDFENVTTSPLSTFSIDVDKASYSNVRRMINNGVMVPADAVKTEEMINYFEYMYQQPTDSHPFAIHSEYDTTPWNKDTQLIKIGIKGKEIPQNKIPASNLVFLLDVSGSMDSPNKLPLLKKSFKLLVNQLREKDKVSIVVYAGAAGLVLNTTSGINKNKINQALENLSAGGSTAGGQGLELAYKIAKDNFIKNGNNRVILATDGDFNVGMSSDRDMKSLIEEKRKSGVFLTCLGFGMGNYKDSKLETLADKGNGNHAYIDTMQEAQRVLGKEFGGTLYTIAKDVKIQVEFNPGKIQAYRLIGYENRLLADEDFVDDTKDAGELGSGHTVTALYEVVPIGVESEYLKNTTDLKYTTQQENLTYGNELLTVKFRYKKPNEDKSIEMMHVLQTNEKKTSSSDFKFAASVAWFSMKLRNSKYIKNQDIDRIVALAEANRGGDSQGYRAEFIRLMKSYNVL